MDRRMVLSLLAGSAAGSNPFTSTVVPLSASNCHQIAPGSKLSGVVDLSAACASTMGISVPIGVKVLFVELAPPKTFSEADIFGD